MPCGKTDCSGCLTCKYDLPIGTPLKNINSNMKNFGIVQMDSNPSTSQLILPHKRLEPLESGRQLALPFKPQTEDSKISEYCNECPHFMKTQRGEKSTFNARCTAMPPVCPGSYKVIKLSVYPQQKVHKPFWCPIVKNSITNSLSGATKIGDIIMPKENKSALSDTQLKEWERIREEKRRKDIWLGMSGITSWEEIKMGHVYHMPPTLKKNRMDIKIRTKYQSSIEATNIKNNERLWLYKIDEEYKFLTEIK